MYLLWATIGQYSLLSPHSPINRKVTKLQKRKDKVPVHLQSFVVLSLGINIFSLLYWLRRVVPNIDGLGWGGNVSL